MDAAPIDLYRDAAPIDLYRDASPIDLYRDAAPIDLYRDASPIDLCRDAAPIDLCRDAVPIDLCRDAAPIDLCRDAVPLTCRDTPRLLTQENKNATYPFIETELQCSLINLCWRTADFESSEFDQGGAEKILGVDTKTGDGLGRSARRCGPRLGAAAAAAAAPPAAAAAAPTPRGPSLTEQLIPQPDCAGSCVGATVQGEEAVLQGEEVMQGEG